MSTRVAVARVASVAICVLPLLFLLAVCAGADAAATRVVEYPLAIDGDYAVIGAPWQGDLQGAAYILKRSGDGWREPLPLIVPDLGRFDHFGAAVSISGDYAAVGAPWQDLFRGAAYVFKRDGGEWVFVQKLTGTDARPDDQFGRTVVINGNDITIGAAAARSLETGMVPICQFTRDGAEWVERGLETDPAVASKLLNADNIGIAAVADSDYRTLTERMEREIGPSPILPASVPDSLVWVRATDSVFEKKVEVTWSSVPEDAIIYKIYRDNTLLSVASSEDSLYTDEIGVPGVIYDYCVVVSDMIGDTTAWKCDPGSRIIFPPANVSASDGLFDKFVRVSWSDRSAIATGYIIRRDGVEIDTLEAIAASVLDDSTAVREVPYYYEVIGIDADANRARPIGDDGFRGLIMPPLAVSASDGEFPDHVLITWTDQANNEVGYIINRDGVVLDSTAANASSYQDFSAVSGVAHDYCVRTYGLGDTVSIEVCDKGGVDILPAPDSVSATDAVYDDRVEITWDDASDLEDGYEIRRDGTVIDSGIIYLTQSHPILILPVYETGANHYAFSLLDLRAFLAPSRSAF